MVNDFQMPLRRRCTHAFIAVSVAGSLALSLSTLPQALAEPSESDGASVALAQTPSEDALAAQASQLDAEISELQQKVETTARDYDDAVAKVEEIEQQIQDNSTRLNQLNAVLPTQEARSAESVKALYMMQQDGGSLLDAILGSENINDFLALLQYMNSIQEHNSQEIQKLFDMREELETTQESLSKAQEDAKQALERAQRALEQAQQARQEANQRAVALAVEQAAAQQARDAAAQAAEAAQAAQEVGQDAQNTVVDTSARDTSNNIEGTVDSNSVNWSSDKKEFVATWSSRIDDYLSGSALAGQGRVFAEAAWDYGVDPRWSPAIAYKESSLGAHCFKPHNAWGWGSSSWSSWDEAIRAHVSGLARVYGNTLTIQAAKKYCPPSSTEWYNTVLAQMNSI